MKIREIRACDRAELKELMSVFYSSPAVYTSGSLEIFENDINACLSGSPYLSGYVLEEEGKIAGYMMCAKSFSTEFGRSCVWLEDLYIREEYRGLGFGKLAMEYLGEKYSTSVLRLEVEEDNERAVELYRKSGFSTLPYLEMYLNPEG